MNFTDLTGYGASGVARIDITSSTQQDWRLIIGEVTPSPQALKGRTISFTLTNFFSSFLVTLY